MADGTLLTQGHLEGSKPVKSFHNAETDGNFFRELSFKAPSEHIE